MNSNLHYLEFKNEMNITPNLLIRLVIIFPERSFTGFLFCPGEQLQHFMLMVRIAAIRAPFGLFALSPGPRQGGND